MSLKSSILFLSLLSGSLFAYTSYVNGKTSIRENEEQPCSTRYGKATLYTIPQNESIRSIDELLDDWKAGKKRWGEENVSLSRNETTGEVALRIHYPQGSINPGNEQAPRGGAGFYLNPFENGKPVTAACLQYRVFFPDGFAFGKGGKLPGLYGGTNEKGESASGCRPGVEMDAFSTRYMWRENGAGSVYAYIPSKTEKCGTYIGKGKWRFTPGKWTELEQEVVMNTPGADDGAIRVWADGKLVVNQPSIMLRTKEDVTIDGIFFVTFFGGKDPAWASPRSQTAEFSGLKLFVRD